MTMPNALILGATSDMATAIARRFAFQDYSITLAARNPAKMAALESDLRIRYRVQVHKAVFDATDLASHASFYESLPVKPDVVFCVFGFLGDQKTAERDWRACEQILVSNFVGAVSILNIVANDMEDRGRGVMVGITSVAGERGRQSNYLYGSAKAAFTAYLSGLRNRLFRRGVHVLTVKPGFVRTRMLDGMVTPAFLTSEPSQVADDIYNAVTRRRNVIYTSGIWRPVMCLIRNIPEPIFKKMKL